MPRKPSVWVLYKWEELGMWPKEELKVQSKDAWQSSTKTATDKSNRYRATFLMESTDRELLEKMRDLTKE